jgi:membrane protein implicated in regulation of membrane protease activity
MATGSALDSSCDTNRIEIFTSGFVLLWLGIGALTALFNQASTASLFSFGFAFVSTSPRRLHELFS